MTFPIRKNVAIRMKSILLKNAFQFFSFWDVDELMNVKDKFNEFLKELRVSTNFFLTMTFTAALHFFAEESSDFITAIEHVDLVYFMPNQMFFPARAFKSGDKLFFRK